MVGKDVVGVLKVEDMMMPAGEAEEQLRAFFTYAALVLKNEIHNYARLSNAYDDLNTSNTHLTKEIGQRKKAEKKLRESKRQLEAKVRERTRTLRTLSESNQTLMHATDEQQLLQDVCAIAVDIGGYRLAWVGLIEHDEDKSIRPVAWAGADAGYVEHIKVSWGTGSNGQGPGGRCIRERKPIVARDTEHGPKFAPWREEALRRGYRSNLSLPLFDSTGAAFGEFAIYAEEPDAFDAKERALLAELAGDLAYGIGTLRDRQKRAYAEKQSCDAASYARSVIEAAPDPLVAISSDGTITDVNTATEEATGVPRDRLIGSDFASYLTEPDKARAGFRNVLEVGVVRDFPLTLKRASGETMDVLYSGTVHRDAAGEVQGVLITARDVTEAKKAQAQLARLAAIVTSSQDAIFTKSLDDVVTNWNAAAETLYGYSAGEMIGKDIAVLAPPERKGESRQLVEHVVRGERIAGFETQRQRKDGGLVDISLTMSPILDDADDIAAVSVIGHDITERKQAEEAVRASEERYRDIFDNSVDALYLLEVTEDGHFRNLEVNPAFVASTGMSRDQLIGKTIQETVPQETADVVNAKYRRCVAAGEPIEEEATLDLPTGRHFYISTLIPLRDGSGRVDRILGISRDVTERKRAEEALRASQQRLALHVEQTLLGVIEWDTDFCVTEWNPAAEAIFGYTSAEVIGHNASDLILSKARRPEIDALFDHLMQQKASEFSTGENVTKDGRTILCEWVNTPLVDQSGTVVGGMSLARDITERQQAEALRIAKEAAEAANVAKTGFLANMSHEIRTPLNAILGFSQLMRRDEGLSARQRQQLDIINNSGEHLLELVNDVLEMAKIESGRVTLNPTAFDLKALMDSLEKLFSGQADSKGLRLRFIRSDDVPRFLIADESRLRQVFVNLLGNAVKFTEKGGVTLRVGARREESGALHLVAEVEDTGPGIASEELDRLFEYFEQAGAGRRAESGTGLGLAISRGFVHLLGGEITVRSEVGEGSVFSFCVAVEEAGEKASAGGAEARRVTGLRAGEPRRRVLIADDAADNRELLVQLLEPIGFGVRAVSDGKQAVAEFRSWHPDLILMDMRMPVMDGYEATRRIRATPVGAHVPIIGVTASVFSEMRHEVFAAGVDDFLGKPFSDSELFDKIGRLLGSHYVYAEEAATPEPEEGGALSAEAVAALPGDLVDRIRRATVAADFDAVLDLADEVDRIDHQIAKALRSLADRFDSERILAVLPGGEGS